jgi:hypothetical protein
MFVEKLSSSLGKKGRKQQNESHPQKHRLTNFSSKGLVSGGDYDGQATPVVNKDAI